MQWAEPLKWEGEEGRVGDVRVRVAQWPGEREKGGA
jgi:hypothetical protein